MTCTSKLWVRDTGRNNFWCFWPSPEAAISRVARLSTLLVLSDIIQIVLHYGETKYLLLPLIIFLFRNSIDRKKKVYTVFLMPNILKNKGLFQIDVKYRNCWQDLYFKFFCFSLLRVVQAMAIILFFLNLHYIRN